MTPRVVDRKAKQKQILRDALKVFAKSGVHNFKMSDIAEAASVGKGTLYEYFPSKDELVVGSFALFMKDFDQYLSSQLAQVDAPAEKMERLIAASLEFCLGEKERLNALFGFYAAGIPGPDGKPLLGNLAPIYRRTIKWVSKIVTEGVEQGAFRPVDCGLVASMIMAMLDGLLFQAALGVTALEAKDMSLKINRAFLHGLLGQERHKSQRDGE